MNGSASLHWSQCEFVVVDVEGNGQSPQEIIELAIVPIRQAHISDTWREWQIRPTKPVTIHASRVHGIFDSDLAGKPKFDDIAHEIANDLGYHAVVGHNVAIDAQLLKERLPMWKPLVAIDTLKLAKWVIPGKSSYALDALANEFGINELSRKSHRAGSDALATAQLFLLLTNMLDQRGQLHLSALAEISAAATDPFFQTSQRNLF